MRARIQPGQTVLIHAGAGGVGHIAVQLARLHGCRVITTAGREESIAFCRDVLHADEVIDYRRIDFAERTRELTQGRGVPVIIDTVGGDVFQKSLDCVSVNGQVATILGAGTGERGRGLLYKNVTIHYEFMGIPTAHEIEPERPGANPDRHRAARGLRAAQAVGKSAPASRADRGRPPADRDGPDHRQGGHRCEAIAVTRQAGGQNVMGFEEPV